MFEQFVRWMYYPGGIIFSAAVLLVGVIVSWRKKRVPAMFVFLIAVTTLFWQETYGDWGAYVRFDPNFAQMPWGPWPYTAPSKPWGILGGYTWFQGLWGLFCAPFIIWAASKLPKWNTYLVAVLVTIPIWYVWDVAIEYSSVRAGVWSYIDAFGPAIHSESGQFPLVWPILMQIPFNAFTAWIVFCLRRDPNGITPLDRFVPVAPTVSATTVAAEGAGAPAEREAPRWNLKYDVARLVTWCVAFNVVFFVTCIGPLMLARILFGAPNALIP